MGALRWHAHVEVDCGERRRETGKQTYQVPMYSTLMLSPSLLIYLFLRRCVRAASTFALNRIYYFCRVYSRAHTNTHRRRSSSRYPGSTSLSMSMCKIECYDINRSQIFLFRSLHTMRNMLQASRLWHVGLFGSTNTSTWTHSVSSGIGKSWKSESRSFTLSRISRWNFDRILFHF